MKEQDYIKKQNIEHPKIMYILKKLCKSVRDYNEGDGYDVFSAYKDIVYSMKKFKKHNAIRDYNGKYVLAWDINCKLCKNINAHKPTKEMEEKDIPLVQITNKDFK